MTKKHAVKSLIKNFANRSTTHGVSAIGYGGSIFTRILWALIFLVLLSYMIFTTTTTIISFLKFETVTSISIKHEENMTFPSVTICRNNLVSRSLLPDDFIVMLERKAAELKSNISSAKNAHAFQKNISLSIQLAMENHNLTVPKEPPMLLKAIPDSCLFAQSVLCNVTSDFKPTYKADSSGRCYTFNSGNGNKYVQFGSGPYFGLSLTLYVNQSDYVPLADNQDGAGFTVYIQKSDTLPFMGMGGVLVAPGHVTRIALSKSELVLKKTPYTSNCSEGDGILNYFPGGYSVISCKISCALHRVFNECGYADPLIKEKLNNASFRETTAEMLQCRDAVIASMLVKRKICDCPSACFAELFSPTVSASRWPTDVDLLVFRYMFASALGRDPQNITDNLILGNFAKVNIFYDDLSTHRFVEKETGDVYDLLSDIGGHLGFWTGASLFSVVEALALIVGIFSIVLHKSARKLTAASKNRKEDSNNTNGIATINGGFDLYPQ